MKKSRAFVLLSLLAVSINSSHARYRFPKQEFAPLARVISNLEKKLKTQKDDIDVKVNLARAYVMGATLNLEGVSVNTGPIKTEDQLVVPPMGSVTPGKVQSIGVKGDQVEFQSRTWKRIEKKDPVSVSTQMSPEVYKREPRVLDLPFAKKYMDQAKILLKEVISVKPDHPLANMVLGWCFEHEGKKSEAIPYYRKTFTEAIKNDHWTPFGQTLSQEAGAALVPLLDSAKDKGEIEWIQKQIASAHKQPSVISPILVPVREEKSLEQLVDLKARVKFSLNGLNDSRSWQWIRPNAAWLVYDPEISGQILSGRQLFGNATFWLFFKNGYEALASLDNDANSVLEQSELTGLSLWQDLNSNGVSDPGEVKPVAEWGIQKISTRYELYRGEIIFAKKGIQFRDGWRPTYDWIAESRASR